MVRWYVQGLVWTLVFYPTGNPVDAAAAKIASAFAVSDVKLWPTEDARIYRVQWFNHQTERFHDDYVRVYPHA